jgi:tetratricopeptide (TPR) repeat protein/peroxiredoxin
MSLVLVASLLLLQTQSNSPDQLIQQAIALQQAGNLEEAARAYRAFLTERPGEVGARSNLGVVLAQLGRFDEAEAEYQEALRRDPANLGIQLNLALAYYKSGHIPEAIQQLTTLREKAGDTKQVLLLLADCYLRMGQNEKVIELLRPLRQKDADDLGIAYLLGTALLRDRKIEEGQIVIDRILRDGNSAESHFLLGTQSFASGDFPGAVKQFGQAVAIRPDLPSLQSYYGQALLYTGDADGASAAFRQELAKEPNDYDANLRLAEILKERRKLDEAIPFLRRALRVRPSSIEGRLDWADLCAAQGHWDEARQVLESLVHETPDLAAAHQQLAVVYQHLHLAPQAKQEQVLFAKLNATSHPEGRGLQSGDTAPDFTLFAVNSKDAISLHSFRARSPVLLVFGSYTCPNFRSAAPAIRSLFERFGTRVPFLLVYIREAHSTEDWQSTRNDREGVVLPPSKTMEQKTEHASMCARNLRLPFPAVVDSIDGKVESAYASWPSKAYLVDRNGIVRYSTGLSELDFRPSELERALRQVAP